MQYPVQRKGILWFLLAFLVAASLRFIKLGYLPLSNNEADLALQAFAVARGTTTVIGGQPGYVALTAFLFTLFSANNFWALFWPALFGSAFVFVPYLFKDQLSETTAVLLAFLFAFDPGLVAISRTANAEMITIASSLAAFGFLIKKRSLWAGVFLGIAILGGAPFWPGFMALIGVVLISYLGKRKDSKIKGDPIQNGSHGINWRLFTSFSIAVIVLIGTGFSLYPAMISGLGSGFVEYFSSWSVRNGVSIKTMIIGFSISELFAIPLAIWTGVLGWKKRVKGVGLLGLGLFLFLILALANASRQVVDWTWALIPMLTLAAIGLTDLWSRFKKVDLGIVGVQAAITISLCVFSCLNLLNFQSNPPVDSTSLRNGILEVTLPLAFLILVTMLLTWGWSSIGSRQGLLIGIGMILLFVTIGSGWKAAGLGPHPENELWRSDGLPVGNDLLLKTTKEISLHTNGQENRVDIAVIDFNQPALLWSLKNYDRLTRVMVLGQSEPPSIIISSPDSSIGLAASYRGEEIRWTASIDYDNLTTENWIKWFFSREAPEKTKNLLLWARNDLFKNSNTN